jgi:hypothetical protein
MYGIKSREGRWSVSLRSCSQDTAHCHYSNVMLHISLEDLRNLGIAMQSVTDRVEQPEQGSFSTLKKGLVQ